MIVSQTLRVIAVRSQDPKGFGGCIFSARPVGDRGEVRDAASYYVVRASRSALADVLVQPGQCWRVSGTTSIHRLGLNGYQVTEWQIEASSAQLLRPSGEHIIAFIAGSPAFVGIGEVKARKLWDTFGERLYQLLDDGDVVTLASVLSPDSAELVARAWAAQGDSRTLQWLQAQGFDLKLGRKILQFFGAETAQKLEEDPYRLLSFCATWRQVDALARSKFNVPLDDPRRLKGAVEEACYRMFAAGHTIGSMSSLMDAVGPILGPQTVRTHGHQLLSGALSDVFTNGSFVITPQGVQLVGPMAMEATVASAIAERIKQENLAQLLDAQEIDAVLERFEHEEELILNAEQRQALHLAASQAFVCITGGAGVGKTTVLKALYALYDQAGIGVVQVALAGRAAKRMHEATGRPALTIASFLRTRSEGDFATPMALVVDEASMVDIIGMSRLCEMLPTQVRIVLVGDPHQLMPVGPGLVLHVVRDVSAVPVVELTVVKRYGDEIRHAALKIRDGEWPTLAQDESAAISFLPCHTKALSERVVALYEQDLANTQILSPRRHGAGGTNELNALCQKRFRSGHQPLMVWNEEHGRHEYTGLRLGDRVLCTRNLWSYGLQNGSLGRIVQIEDRPRALSNGEGEEVGHALAWIDWDDGSRLPLVESMLDDIDLGDAITVHKAQGSQWPRVIIPVSHHRLLDRTLLYTGVTRAQRQVLLVGDEEAARAAVRRAPRAQTRRVALGMTLDRRLRMLGVDVDQGSYRYAVTGSAASS